MPRWNSTVTKHADRVVRSYFSWQETQKSSVGQSSNQAKQSRNQNTEAAKSNGDKNPEAGAN